MDTFDFDKMQEIQRELREKYKGRWTALSPEMGRSSLLWMMVEAGEAADIIKKDGDRKIMDVPEVREHFIEELCDVMMYFNDVMLCYGIAPEELERVYLEKHRGNLERW